MNVISRHFFNAAIAAIVAASSAQAQGVPAEQKPVGVAQGVLASAKMLYVSASYEAALLELNSTDVTDDLDQVDTYKALCLLALDRQRDAERALETLVTRKPLYAISDAEYSPRLVAMFHDVRKRALPAAARQLYSAAKVHYEAKNYASAAAKFKELFLVLSDSDLSDEGGKLTDLRELADGFLKLSEQKLVADAPAVVAPRPAAALVTPEASPAPARLYTAVDAGVRAPLVIQQKMPEWVPPQQSQFLHNRAYSGRLEIVIDEQGTVEKATVVKSIWPSYDPLLLQATKNWKYQPAQLDGKAVKFVKSMDVTVNSAPGPTRP
jgi:tetratricopeptide (TPR) repeat protein